MNYNEKNRKIRKDSLQLLKLPIEIKWNLKLTVMKS